MSNATQQVHDYPQTAGKRIALRYFYWSGVTKEVAEMIAPSVVRLAQTIDHDMKPVCALLKTP